MRPSVRPITASTTSGTWTRTTTCTSPSTTPMTMLTSTIAWCTPCVERARRAHSFTPGDIISHLIGSSPESFHNHLHVIHGAPSLTRFSLSISTWSFLSFSVYFFHSELYPELDNPIVMESLCHSANKESEDAYDVSTSFTELLLIGCLIESIWTPRSKSNTLTPRTNSQTYWQREIAHVMNGIIFSSELVRCAANKYGKTRYGRWLIKLLRMKHWRQLVFSRVEIWWNVGSKNGETRRWTTIHPGHRQVCHR